MKSLTNIFDCSMFYYNINLESFLSHRINHNYQTMGEGRICRQKKQPVNLHQKKEKPLQKTTKAQQSRTISPRYKQGLSNYSWIV